MRAMLGLAAALLMAAPAAAQLPPSPCGPLGCNPPTPKPPILIVTPPPAPAPIVRPAQPVAAPIAAVPPARSADGVRDGVLQAIRNGDCAAARNLALTNGRQDLVAAVAKLCGQP